jgi:hypothetical protein
MVLLQSLLWTYQCRAAGRLSSGAGPVCLERVAAICARGRFKERPVQIGEAPQEIRALGEAPGDMADGIDRRAAR